jgi:hypothetical protein
MVVPLVSCCRRSGDDCAGKKEENLTSLLRRVSVVVETGLVWLGTDGLGRLVGVRQQRSGDTFNPATSASENVVQQESRRRQKINLGKGNCSNPI